MTTFCHKKYFLAALLAVTPMCGYADNNAYQLKTYIRTSYPADVKTVRDMLLYIISGTDFRLYMGRNLPDDAMDILRKPHPYYRKASLTSRQDALLMAIGDDNSLVIDFENNLISVTRNPIDDI